MIPQGTARRETAAALGAAIVCCAFALASLPGFPAHASTHLTPDLQDPLLNLVLLKWGARQWMLGLPAYWDANFFFPSRGVIALSDHLIGPSLAFALLGRLGAGPIAAYNTLLLLALAASPWSLCLLLRRLGASWGGGLAGGLAWGFAAYRVSHLAHLQLLLSLWIPPLVWSLDRLLERPRAGRAALFLALYLLHLSGGSYLAYMGHFLLAAVVVARRRSLVEALKKRRAAVALGFAALAAIAMAASIYVPYVRYGRELGAQRTTAEAARFGASGKAFVTAAGGTPFDLEALQAKPEGRLSPGLVATLLGIAGVVTARRGRETPLARALLGGALVCLALSFAPVFLAAARLLPGLSGLRVPSRFVQLAGIGLALLAARGLDALRDRLRSRSARVVLTGAVVVALGVELLPARGSWEALGDEAEFPAVDHWIASQPEVRAYVDLPFPPPNRLTREYLKMYLSTLHWKGLVNGRSGYSTGLWNELHEAIEVMPDATAVERLRELGVTHVVVRETGMYEGRSRRERWIAWRDAFERDGFPGLESVYRDDEGGWVFRIVAAAPAPT